LAALQPITHKQKENNPINLINHFFCSFLVSSLRFFVSWRKEEDKRQADLAARLFFGLVAAEQCSAHNPPQEELHSPSHPSHHAALPVNNSLSSARPLGRASCNER